MRTTFLACAFLLASAGLVALAPQAQAIECTGPPLDWSKAGCTGCMILPLNWSRVECFGHEVPYHVPCFSGPCD